MKSPIFYGYQMAPIRKVDFLWVNVGVYIYMSVFQKYGYPKMDGENNGSKPY